MKKQNAKQRQLIGNGGHKDIFAITIDGESKVLYRISDKEFYSSIEEISLKYNVNVFDIYKNIQNGKSLLTDCKLKQSENIINVGTKKHAILRGFEHNGVFYESHKAFADAHNLNYKRMMERLKSGWTYEDCIVGKRIKKEYKRQIHEIYGKIYHTVKEISVEFNIPVSTLSYHLADGKKTAEEIVTAYKKEIQTVKSSQHYIPREKIVKFEFEGQPYSSERKLCEIKGINYNTFAKRKSRGWSLNECVYGKKRV